MQSRVMARVRRLMAQQIPVRPCLFPAFQRIILLFSERQSNRTIWEFRPDRLHHLQHPVVRHRRILTALQNKGAESQLITILTAGKNLLPTQAVPACISIAPSDAAIKTVVFAIIAALNESPHIHRFSVLSFPDAARFFKEVVRQLR